MPYLNVVEIESALTALSAAYPGTCELITLPNLSHENRTTHAVRIALGPLDGRPAVLFAGGQHAREWGTGDICISFATDLLDAYATNSGLTYGGQVYSAGVIRRIMEDGQVFIYPCINPDGKNYSQNTYAMWRKNRNPGGAVDLNRNYDVLWDFATALHPGAGAAVSGDPTSDVYHGTAPFSEPETQNVKWLFDSYPQIRWAIDIHSYSQLLYHNWGHDQNQITNPAQVFTDPAFDGDRGLEDDAYGEYILSEDLGTQCGLVERMQTALAAVRGITYQTGQSFDLYPTTGTLSDYPYSRHIVDPTKTKTHGFLIEWGMEFQPPFAEMENIIEDVSSALIAFTDHALDECAILDISLETPSLQFIDVPESETTYRAVTFRTTACCSLEFMIVDGPDVGPGSAPGTAFGTPLGTSDIAPAAPGSFSNAHLWISYTGTDEGNTADGTVTVRCRQTNQQWVVPISTNVIERPSAAIMMVLDQSGSMGNASGISPGITREAVLEFSAPPVVDIIESNNRLGILQFDHDIHPKMDIKIMNMPNKGQANGILTGYDHNPLGYTSIGEAVFAAREALKHPSVTQDVKAMIVLTDGREEHGPHDRRFISQVADQIDSRVYAIGLGTPTALNPGALQALCDGTDGYMMMTGPLDSDAEFRLMKYYQQILAGVTNTDIIVDPDGMIKPGQKHEIPFRLSETDISSDVILMSTVPHVINFSMITPTGDVIKPGTSAMNPAIDLGAGQSVKYYRMRLPVSLGGPGSHGGLWRAVLEIDEKLWVRYLKSLGKSSDDVGPVYDYIEKLKAHGIRYAVMCRSWSNLKMSVNTSQTSFEPGAFLTLRARLSEFGVPVEGRAKVVAEVSSPDNVTSILEFDDIGGGIYEADVDLLQIGVTTFRILAKGTTFRGTHFTREQTVTGSVWHGGDREPPGSGGSGTNTGIGTRPDLCCLLDCLIQTDSGQRFLKKQEIDIKELQECLKHCCD